MSQTPQNLNEERPKSDVSALKLLPGNLSASNLTFFNFFLISFPGKKKIYLVVFNLISGNLFRAPQISVFGGFFFSFYSFP